MSAEKANQRNGKVEFLRLVFCLCVFAWHIISSIGVKSETVFGALPFLHGRLGVEFFFLLSGFFLAAAARKFSDARDLSIGRETFRFTLRKVNSILPYHLLLFPLTLLVRFCFKNFDSLHSALNWLIRSVPAFFLFIGTGADEVAAMGDEWYISKMLLAGFILFPLLLKYRKTFARIVCPLLAMLLTDYMMYTTGMLGGVEAMVFNGAVAKTFIRALAEMALGIFMYEVVEYLKRCRLDKRWIRTAATVLEAVLYLFCLYFIFCKSNLFEVYFLYFAAAALTITLSGISYGKTLFNRKIFYLAGEMTLPIYLSQRAVIVFFENSHLIADLGRKLQFVIIFALTVALAFLVRFAAQYAARLIRKAGYAVLPEEDARAILR